MISKQWKIRSLTFGFYSLISFLPMTRWYFIEQEYLFRNSQFLWNCVQFSKGTKPCAWSSCLNHILRKLYNNTKLLSFAVSFVLLHPVKTSAYRLQIQRRNFISALLQAVVTHPHCAYQSNKVLACMHCTCLQITHTHTHRYVYRHTCLLFYALGIL